MDEQDRKAFNALPRLAQRQDSLDDQIRDLIPFAEKLGMRDAADFLKVKRIMDRA